MTDSSPERERIARIYRRHIDTVYRVCFLFLKKHSADLEDAVQTTFLRLLQSAPAFESDEHEKAWLIVTASNVCKNMLASAWNRKVRLDDRGASQYAAPFVVDEVIESVMALPDAYKTVIYLHYYEGYPADRIARLLGKSQSAIWGYLHRGRKRLRRLLEEEER